MQDRTPPTGHRVNAAAVLHEEQRGAVAILTLSRPSARNALNLELLAALQSAIDRVSVDCGISAVVLSATMVGR